MDLREYLFRKRLSVAEFARRIDHSRNYISQIAQGNHVPSPKLARMIEKATDGEVTVAELLKEKGV